MKKTVILVVSLIMLMLSGSAVSAIAADATYDTPVLTSISFKNAEIDGGFSPERHEYTITLDDPIRTPSLENYEIKGYADIFITYSMDNANHQTGIIATLEYETGSMIYSFMYSNAQSFTGSNNLLADIECELGEVYPSINEKDTAYKLYIPCDLEEVKLTPVTQETGAYCDLPNSIRLNSEQEPILTLNVTAANGDTRRYTIKVKRLKKNCEQIKSELKYNSFTDIIKSELLHQKPVFRYSVIGAIVLAVAILILLPIIKRLNIKVYDNDEIEFFN